MKFRFASTALDGRTMTLTARQDDLVGGPITVSDWGTPLTDDPNASVTISVTRTPSKTAPEHVYFEITGWDGFDTGPGDVEGYDARMHDFVYLWDFGDAGATYTAPVNVLAAWRDANKGYGPKVAHVYSRPSQPGTPYIASVLVIEPDTGKIARAQVELTVEDPDVTFGKRLTYHYSATRNHAGAPEGAQLRSDLPALWEELRKTDKTQPKRIMLARGEETTLENLVGFSSTPDFHMVAEPLDPNNPLPKPILRQALYMTNRFVYFRGDTNVRESVFQNIDFIGHWDTETETSSRDDGRTTTAIDTFAGGHYLVDNCLFSGWSAGVGANGDSEASRACWITLHNTHITNWWNFGYWAAGVGQTAVLGTMIAQDVEASSGGPKDGFHNIHGPVRHQPLVPSTLIVDGSDFFSRNGWFRNVGDPLYHTQQPGIRYNQSQIPGTYLNVQRSGFEGGFPCIVGSRFNNSVDDVICNMIVERSVFVGSHMSDHLVATSSGGMTVRGNLMIHPDVQRLDGLFDPRQFVRNNGEKVPDGTTTYNAPTKIIGNTMINLMSSVRRADDGDRVVEVMGTKPGLVVIEENNLVHQPNLDTPIVGNGPLDQTPLWTPRELGYRDQDYPVRIDATATPVDSVWSAFPLAGSPALGASTSDDTAYDDLYGEPRPAYPSLGALEMKG